MSAPAWWLVTRREVLAKLTDKTFLIGTVVTVGLIAAFMGVQAIFASNTDEYTLAVGPDDRAMADQIVAAAKAAEDDTEVDLEEVADRAAAETALREDDADAWLHRESAEGGAGTTDGWVLTWESSEDPGLALLVQSTISQSVLTDNAARAGTTLEELSKGAQVRTDLLKGDEEQVMVAEIASLAFVFLFYLAALIFGYQLAYSVIEEKQSRIVEIIAAAIPLRHLLAGKVIGNTVLAFVQMTLYVVVGLVGMSFTPYRSYVTDLTAPVLWFLAFFAAGFVALACLWAVAGALASRTEDVQATGTPLMVLIMGIFFGALMLDGRAEVIGSFVPPLSAVAMPTRLLMGDAAWWEALIALGLLGVFTAVTVWIGERLYRRALMQSGGRVSLKQAWTAGE
jgi:ABC-2 type transport system permease protein